MPERIKPIRGYNIKANGDQLELDNTQRADTSSGVIIGNPWGYISDVNDLVVSICGAKDKTEIVGRHILQFIKKEDKDRTIAESLASIELEKARTEVYTIQANSGKEMTFEVYIDFIENEDGEKIGFIDIIRPI